MVHQVGMVPFTPCVKHHLLGILIKIHYSTTRKWATLGSGAHNSWSKQEPISDKEKTKIHGRPSPVGSSVSWITNTAQNWDLSHLTRHTRWSTWHGLVVLRRGATSLATGPPTCTEKVDVCQKDVRTTDEILLK